MTTLIQAELPEQLARQGQALINSGWMPDMNSLLTEALRRYLESHPEALTETFVREDVEWGLRGND